MLRLLWWTILVALPVAYGGCATEKRAPAERTEPAIERLVIDLNGVWEVEQGSMDSAPESFEHNVQVPGLVDMADPAFEEVGKKSEKRQAFWYRREFAVDAAIPDVAILKINKAKYGTKVFLNGALVGEHLPCSTPALLDVKEFLKGAGQQNELIVRVGAERESMPEGMPTGWDFEKYLYIPGIYDSVELILAGSPYISNIQTVPDIENERVKVVAKIEAPGPAGFEVHFRLREVLTGNTVRSGAIGLADTTGERGPVSFSISVNDCHLWSPEDPFLYELELWTAGDKTQTRFGMRSFGVDAEGDATSDHFNDLEEPTFERHGRDAFSPVGLLIDFRDDELEAGSQQQFKVYVINDHSGNWTGTVSFSIARGGDAVAQQSSSCSVDAQGREILSFALTVPDEAGEYQLVARLVTADGNEACSVRDFNVVSAE